MKRVSRMSSAATKAYTCLSTQTQHVHLLFKTQWIYQRWPVLLPGRTLCNIFMMLSYLKRIAYGATLQNPCLLLTSALLASPSRLVAYSLLLMCFLAFPFPNLCSLPSWVSPLPTLQDPNAVRLASSIKSFPMSSLTSLFLPQVLQSSQEISFLWTSINHVYY